MDNVDDGVLLYHNPETLKAEILVDEHRRSDVPVQERVMALIRQSPGSEPRFVALSELQRCREHQTSEDEKTGLTLQDIKKDVSRRQGEVLSYFKVAGDIGASDIHVTTRPGLTRFEMRIHGELETISEQAEEEGNALGATIVLSMCDVTEPMFFPGRKQDGRVAAEFLRKVGLFGARYSHTSTADGFNFVMRVIPDDGDSVQTLEALGFLPEHIRLIARMLRLPEGMMILSGPTGSGKSTTLRVCADMYLNRTRYKKRLLTVEDPPEGRIPGAIQTPILCDKADDDAVRLAWQWAITSALRLDPDAIMPGELRDLLSMMAAMFAAQTGHLVMTTEHTNSALSIPERMITMGVKEGLIADAQLLIGLISQRLVQVLCPHCKVPWSRKKDQLTPDQRRYLETYCQVDGLCSVENLAFRDEAGCPECRKAIVLNGRTVKTVGLGVVGRTVVAEVIRPDATLFQLLLRDGKDAAKHYWLTQLGGITRRTHLLHKLNAGQVDPLAADDVIPLDEDDLLLDLSTSSASSDDTRWQTLIAQAIAQGVKAGIEAGLAAQREDV